MANIDQLSAARIAAGVAAGEFSATEVAKASLDAIDARDEKVQAFLQVSSDLALAAAAETDRRRAAGEKLGPLAGVPVAFKDNMHLVGTRTTCASKMLENYESTFTATCVRRMLDAGATTHGQGQYGRVRVWLVHRVLCLPPHEQPLGHRARARRLLGRLSCCRRRRRGHHLAGLRHGWLHPPAGKPLRRGGHEAHVWRREPLRRGCLWLLARPSWPLWP